MNITIQKQISKLFELSDNNNALINILYEYCDKIKEAPTSANMFDFLVLLSHSKNYARDLRYKIEQLEDIL